MSAVSLSKIEDFAGCGAITVLVRVEGTSKSARGANTFVKISDASAEIESATEHMLTTGDLIVAEIARKTTERSEEHKSELQSLMRNSYAVFCLKNNTTYTTIPKKSL